MDGHIEITSSNYPQLSFEELPLAVVESLCLRAFIGEVEVSRLNISRRNHQRPWIVGNVQTHPDYVRRGLATMLYRKAKSLVGTIEHSVSRSVYGDAWARSMGHEVPDSPTEQLSIANFELWFKNQTEQADTAATMESYFGTGAYQCTPESLGVLV